MAVSVEQERERYRTVVVTVSGAPSVHSEPGPWPLRRRRTFVPVVVAVRFHACHVVDATVHSSRDLGLVRHFPPHEPWPVWLNDLVRLPTLDEGPAGSDHQDG